METIILIPPSQGKALGGSSPSLTNVNSITLKLIKSIKGAYPQKLYGLKARALEKALKINNNILTSKTMPAVQRYTGVVAKAIDFDTIREKDLFYERVRIVSALFGLIKPDELIPNYNLKIDKLNSAELWHDENSKKLKDVFVIDLLPKAHRKAVSYENGIEVKFVILKNGVKVAAGHSAKEVKGHFIRWLIERDVVEAEDFTGFNEDGFKWNGECFLKEM